MRISLPDESSCSLRQEFATIVERHRGRMFEAQRQHDAVNAEDENYSAMTNKIENLEDLIRWAVSMESQNVAWWQEQRRLNAKATQAEEKLQKRVEDRLDSHSARLSALERRLFWLAGAAAAGGGIIGNLAGNFLGS